MLCHQPVPVQNPPIIENIWFCEVHSVSKWCGRDITNECENQSYRGKKDVWWLHLFSMRKELMCSNLCKAWMFLNYIWSESLNSCRRTTRFWWDDLVHHEVLSCWKKHPFCAWHVTLVLLISPLSQSMISKDTHTFWDIHYLFVCCNAGISVAYTAPQRHGCLKVVENNCCASRRGMWSKMPYSLV